MANLNWVNILFIIFTPEVTALLQTIFISFLFVRTREEALDLSYYKPICITTAFPLLNEMTYL